MTGGGRVRMLRLKISTLDYFNPRSRGLEPCILVKDAYHFVEHSRLDIKRLRTPGLSPKAATAAFGALR